MTEQQQDPYNQEMLGDLRSLASTPDWFVPSTSEQSQALVQFCHISFSPPPSPPPHTRRPHRPFGIAVDIIVEKEGKLEEDRTTRNHRLLMVLIIVRCEITRL